MKIVSKIEIVCCTLAILLVGGVDAVGMCEKKSNYNCGATFPPGGDTCNGKGCCCDGDDGCGLQVNTCDKGKGFTNRGCDSCWGELACRRTTNMNIGSNSCHGEWACKRTSDSTFSNDSCHGEHACRETSDSTFSNNSCHGETACYDTHDSTFSNDSCHGDGACGYTSDSIILNDSCHGISSCSYQSNTKVGSNSCKGDAACFYQKQTTIGNNSCNARQMCQECDDYSNVPDNACNDENGVDTTFDYTKLINSYRCNYCMSIDTTAAVVFVATGTDGRALASCVDNHNGISIMNKVTDIVSQFSALRRLKDTSKKLSSGLAGKQTLTITVKFSARGTNTDEMALNQFLKTKLEENRAASSSCFNLQSIDVVTRDDPASLSPSLKKKSIKSNKKQTAPSQKK